MTRALGLLSGGLDSSLAAMVLRRQEIEVSGIAFATPFFGAGRARRAAEQLGIPLLVREIGEIHLEMVKQPRYGYGKNMNPCIDCHAMMFRLAGQIMREEGFDFLFSGEVLGQRPMSQNATALRTVEKYSGFPGRILRPLSARLLPETEMERSGLVDRARLLDIQGRSRRRQQELARDWGLEEFPSAAGGCLLTERSFYGRLRDLFEHQPDCTVADVELLKVGRQFRLSATVRLALGRNQEDNERIRALAREGDLLLRCSDHGGPLGLVRGPAGELELAQAAALVAAYGKGKEEARVAVQVDAGSISRLVTVAPLAREEAQRLQIE